MNVTDTIYSLDVVKDLPDKEIYQRLFKIWNITDDKIEVWGELQIVPFSDFIKLFNVKTITENRKVNYPFQARHDIDYGIYIPLGNAKALLNGQTTVWIKCELELSPLNDRQKHNNPFELSVKRGSGERLVSLPLFDKSKILNDEVSSYVSEAIYDFHLSVANEKISKAKASIELELKAVDNKHNQASADLKQLVEQSDKLEISNTELKSCVSIQQEELKSLIHQYQKVELEMVSKIDKLKSYITEKALFLKSFEFIDQEDFDSFIVNTEKEHDSTNMLSFSDVLDGDYKQAVSYIQAYLKEQDILYPRHIIENYLTLIRSNDLIILAGDSGSGKTNLVQSFAKAVGGVSKIIPVKPNWTSSEDLLGYYNPLEKKYLATPFLEALIEAHQHPEVPYFICLDEMNLARVEYYFADFLSKLEARDTTPEIQLYSDNESAHVLSELKAVVSIISDAKSKYSQDGIVNFVKLMQDEKVNTEMKRAFGFSDKDSLIKYHGDIRRMLSGIISTPSTIKIPANVRILGAINIDETTHYLSPKILDRAHIMKFKSPLLTNWDEIFAEIDTYGFDDVTKPLHFKIDALGERKTYPKFERDNNFCSLFIELNKEFFDPLGVEFGMRTIRQGLNYLELFTELNDNNELAINNFIIHKVLPKFTFDGNKQSGNHNKLDLLDKVLLPKLESIVTSHELIAEEFSSISALKDIIRNAKANDYVVNYWA
jgi:energy-coupling factor transporter ATP-binding protein EcfA2